MPLYLAYRDKELDLAHRIPGIWALGPKLKLHYEIIVLQNHESAQNPKILHTNLTTVPMSSL
jgi:hypothetical protein